MNELLSILTQLNGGSLFGDQENYVIEKDLYSDTVKLFIDKIDKRYYFFAEYILDEQGDNWNQIQDDSVNNFHAFGAEKPNPSDSYMILFWRVKRIDDVIYSKIINLEENEFFYKKYVLYYTQEEYEALKDWLINNENINIEHLLEMLSMESDEMSLCAKLLVRIITKIPFWILNFPSAVLEDFECMVDKKIVNMRDISKIEIQEMKKFIDNSYGDSNALADAIFSEYLKEWC